MTTRESAARAAINWLNKASAEFDGYEDHFTAANDCGRAHRAGMLEVGTAIAAADLAKFIAGEEGASAYEIAQRELELENFRASVDQIKVGLREKRRGLAWCLHALKTKRIVIKLENRKCLKTT